MSGPLVYISNQRIKEGCLEDYKRYYLETVEWVRANRPGTVANLLYLSEDGTKASVVIVFPDAQAMELHMQGLGDRPGKAFEMIEIDSHEIYGTPSPVTLSTMKKIEASGAAVHIRPQAVGGYLRLQNG